MYPFSSHLPPPDEGMRRGNSGEVGRAKERVAGVDGYIEMEKLTENTVHLL